MLRARESDRNDDGDTLELDVLRLFEAFPETSLRLALNLVTSPNPAARRVGLWSLSVIDFGGRTHFGMVADAASDPYPEVRADVMLTLGTIFGAGNPSRAQVILIVGTRDPAAAVRRAAVAALHASRGQVATNALVASTNDSDRQVRHHAAWSLAGNPAPEARSALKRLSTDEDADVRDVARRVLALPTRSL